MNRFLTTIAALPLCIALGGCPSSTIPAAPASPTVSQDATDAALILSGLQTVVGGLQGVDAKTLATIQADMAKLQVDASAIAAATATPPASNISEFVQVAEALAPIALSFIPGGSALTGLITAAEDLLPAIQAVATAGASPAQAAKFAHARLVLAGARK